MAGPEARVIGTAAGGGFPQWNCSCRLCAMARRGELAARGGAALAVRAAGEWLVIGAPADVAAQIGRLPAFAPPAGSRATPLRRVLLTDAQLDGSIGLVELRQAAELEVLAPPAVLRAVRDELGLGRTLGAYARVAWRELPVGECTELGPDLAVRPIDTAGRPPRYLTGADTGDIAWSVAYELLGPGGSGVYAPAVSTVRPRLADECRAASWILFDGTFWTDDEMARAGVGSASARSMGHLPIDGPGGSLEFLATFPAAWRGYTHINNTNPLLDPRSPERRRVAEAGLHVAEDGEEIAP